MMTQVSRSRSGCFATSHPTRLPLLASLFSFTLPLCIIGSLAPLTTTVAQQVTPDGTVSTTVITPDGKNFTINDGTTRGGNLFHSFKEFSVPTGGSANFNNAPDVQNIIGRVTGSSVSNIDGAIRALGKANLFLLNPNGIIFGPNASLNIGGSFLGSTANSFLFDNGFEFSATDPQAPPLLTINVPIGLRYRDNPGVIQVQGRGHDINFNEDIKKPDDQLPVRVNNSILGLELESGKTLTLVGGKVSLEGAVLNSSSGRIEIGSVASNGTVSLVPVQEGWKLGYESIRSFGDIYFSRRTLLDTKGIGGGSIAVAGKNINFAEESILLADTLGNRNAGEISIVGDKISVVKSEIRSFTFGSGNAGQIKLIADKSILLEDKGGGGTHTQGLGKAGEITVKADSIEVRNSSGVGSHTYGKGDAGRIEVQANSLLIENQAGFGAHSFAEGNAGEINTVVGNFEVSNFSGLGVDAKKGTGNGGKINVRANSLRISDYSGFTSNTEKESTGQGGEVNINVAGLLEFRKNASVYNNTKGAGNAGKINITANSLRISDGGGLNNTTEPGSTGKGGEINVDVKGSVVLQNNLGINNDTKGTGNAGKISIKANDLLISENVGVTNNTEKSATGQGGQINIDVAGPMVVQNSVGINNNTEGAGNAGKISITANSLEISDRSGVTSTAKQGSTGQGGEIIVNVEGPLVLKNAGINSNTESSGNAGQITVRAQSLEISNGGSIGSSTTNTSSGNAGNLNVEAKTVILDSKGKLQVSSTGSGNAGTLKVVADTIKLKNQSSIDATTNSGNGGDLTLDVANFLLLRDGSRISASAGNTGNPGNGGNITINSPLIVTFPNENSDITANAFDGSGGKIEIKTQGIFGIAPLSREELQRRLKTTDFNQLNPGKLSTNDITAISQTNPNLSGTVNINTPDIDPTRGLFELLETIPDPAQQIAQNPCTKGFGSSFTIVGRGGIPTDPKKILSSDNVRVDLVKPVPSTVSSTSATQKQPSQKPPVKEIIPARGWIFNEKGEVLLVGYDPTKTGPQRQQPAPASSCAAR